MTQQDKAANLALDVNVVQLQGSRPRQEDSYLVRELYKGVLVLVADGLGGHERGEEASRVACLATYQALEKALQKARDLGCHGFAKGLWGSPQSRGEDSGSASP